MSSARSRPRPRRSSPRRPNHFFSGSGTRLRRGILEASLRRPRGHPGNRTAPTIKVLAAGARQGPPRHEDVKKCSAGAEAQITGNTSGCAGRVKWKGARISRIPYDRIGGTEIDDGAVRQERGEDRVGGMGPAEPRMAVPGVHRQARGCGERQGGRQWVLNQQFPPGNQLIRRPCVARLDPPEDAFVRDRGQDRRQRFGAIRPAAGGSGRVKRDARLLTGDGTRILRRDSFADEMPAPGKLQPPQHAQVRAQVVAARKLGEVMNFRDREQV